VAKTRRSVKKKSAKATKKSSAPRRKSAKKAAPKPGKPVAARPERIELKKLRKDFGIVLTLLSAKVGTSPEVTAKLDDTRRRISQWMSDVDDICTSDLQEICGPDMAFPLPNP
jgi:hypothetical protein